MAPITALPPHRPQRCTPLPPSAALEQLTAYLTASEKEPYMHPDSMLSGDGIAFSAQGGPMGGLILHNLRRIEKGLRGEVLAPEPEQLGYGDLPGDLGGDVGEGDDTALDALIDGTRSKRPLKSALKRKVLEDEGIDPEMYAQQQEVLEGEIGDRMPASVLAQEEEDDDMVDAAPAKKTTKDKEARKEEKKRRRKEEKREKEMKRSKG